MLMSVCSIILPNAPQHSEKLIWTMLKCVWFPQKQENATVMLKCTKAGGEPSSVLKEDFGGELRGAAVICIKWKIPQVRAIFSAQLAREGKRAGGNNHKLGLLLLLLLSYFSRVRLCVSLGFSRQEHWSGLPFPSPSGCQRPEPVRPTNQGL